MEGSTLQKQSVMEVKGLSYLTNPGGPVQGRACTWAALLFLAFGDELQGHLLIRRFIHIQISTLIFTPADQWLVSQSPFPVSGT